jgi:cytochrome c peroxidase
MKKATIAVLSLSAVVGVPCFAGTASDAGASAVQIQSYLDPAGVFDSADTMGGFDRRGPFFQSLGTNGRSCGTCHLPSQAFTLSAAAAGLTFILTQGRDPLFAPVDGANCPNARPGDASAHSLLLKNGLFRISLPLPASAQFTITVVHDPYGCAITLDPKTGQEDVSVYRRPLPATNLSFLSDVMSDGRETVAPLSHESTFLVNLQTDLKHQASDATTTHASMPIKRFTAF